MKTHLSFLVLAVVAILFSGCASTAFRARISDVDPNKLGPVSVQFDAGSADRPKYLSEASAYGAEAAQEGVGGVLTAEAWKAISLGGGQAEIDRISRATGPFERPLIMNDFQTALKGGGIFIQPNAPASLTLELIGYGIFKNNHEVAYGTVHGFGILKNASGRLVWKAEATGLSASAYNIKDFFTNPQLYKQAIQSASMNFAALLYNSPCIPDRGAKKGYEEVARAPFAHGE